MLVPELEALVAEEPLREERWRLLVLALYRAHRQADALAALRRARQTLADELGVDPGPALRALEAEVLAQSPTLDAPARTRRRDRGAGAAAPGPRSARREPRRGTGGRRWSTATASCGAARRLADAVGGQGRLALDRGAGRHRQEPAARRGPPDRAPTQGALVLTARGSQLEREFGFGAVRQLFERAARRPGARGPSCCAGAAASAAAVFDEVRPPTRPTGPTARSRRCTGCTG